MILLLISADNWGLHGDGENGEDDLSHTISLQLLDTETGLCTFYISTPATAEYYTLVMVAGCNWAGLLLLLAIGHSKKPEVIGFQPSWETFSLIQFFCGPFGA